MTRACLVSCSVCSGSRRPPRRRCPPAIATGVYVPERVYDTARQAFTDLESMLADLAKADVVFVGEQHDDPNTHRLEAAILDGLRRRGVPVTLSLEMFERDTQPGWTPTSPARIAKRSSSRLRARGRATRPTTGRSSSWRKHRGGRSIASNVPRRYASSVAKTGLSALDRLPPAERAWMAADLQCPRGAYFDRFAETMNGHHGPRRGDED